MEKDTRPRRRFLTGTASLPVIFTIQSGSALAAVSNTCRVKDLEKPNPTLLENPGQTSPDEWMRADIQLVTLKVNGSETSYTSPSGRSLFFRKPGDSFYYEYVDDATTPVPLTGVDVPTPGLNVVETPVPNGTRRALIHVDEAGNGTGFAWDTNASGQKLTTSCWTSFKV